MSVLLVTQKEGTAVREPCKGVGFLSNNSLIDRSVIHFLTGEKLVKINGTFGVALHATQ